MDTPSQAHMSPISSVYTTTNNIKLCSAPERQTMELKSDDLFELRNRRRRGKYRIKDLRARIGKLQDQLKRENEEIHVINETIERTLERTHIPEAKAECQKFAALFYTKLPRELRDAVYTYLCVGKKPIIADYECIPLRVNSSRWMKGLDYDDSAIKEDDYDQESPLQVGSESIEDEVEPLFPLVRVVDGAMKATKLPADAIFDPEYVGFDVWREAAEAFYSGNCFDFPDKLGVFPPKPSFIIDGVEIEINQLDWVRKLRSCIHIQVHNDAEHRRRYREDLYTFEERLQGIYRLESRDNLQVEILIMSDLTFWHTVKESDRRVKHFRGVMERVRKVLGDQRNRVMENVKVIHHKTSRNGLFCRDITRLFSMKDEEFGEMVDVLLNQRT